MSNNANTKRPVGLKKSKSRPPTDFSSSEEPVSKHPKLDNDTQTLIIDGEVEEGDEIAELKAIYETALSKMVEDPSEALPLLNGTINECDRILRNLPENTPRPSGSFYLIYGSALLDIGRFSEDDPSPYFDAAIERLEDGIERLQEEDAPKEEGMEARLKAKMGEAHLQKAQLKLMKLQDGDAEDGMKKVEADVDEAIKRFEEAVKAGGERIEMAQCVLAFTEQCEGDEAWECRMRMNAWARGMFESVIKEDAKNTEALTGIGNTYLSVANYWIERGDEDQEIEPEDDEEEKTELTDNEQNAYDALIEGVKSFKIALNTAEELNSISPQLLMMLAESQITLGNLTLDEQAQKNLYKEAVANLKRSKNSSENENFSLPEGLQEFLEEWEA